MAITQKLIKGIKVNGEIAGLDLSRIGSVVHAASGEETGDTELVEYIDSHGGGGGGGTVTELTSQNGTKFNLKVYDNGELYADEIITDTITPEAPVSTERIGKIKGRDIEYLYINSFYCGGLNSNEHTLNYCSHNFVELSNLSNKNICLDNMSLQYRYSNSAWTVFSFKDKGYVIKAGGTFLIRFNQCSNIDGAKILVDDYDVEITGSTASFSTESPSFYLCFGDEPASESTNPGWIKDGTKTVDSRFIDLIGVKTVGDCNAYVNSAYTCLMPLNEVMFRRYYAMDNVKQGTKDIANMSNATEWYYVDLTKDDGDVIPSIKANTPKARIDSKNLYFDKSKLFENKPTVITCSFGIEAVDKEDGKGLSTNDYTTTEKNKLAGIASGAEVNVNADWNATTGDAQILNKPTIPSKISELTNDSNYITSSQKGSANGVCPLDANSKIDSQYLPSYVDDVVEAYARAGQTALSSTWLATGSASGTVITPESGKIYLLMSDSGDYSANTQFRYSGTTYVKLNDGGISEITNSEIDTIVTS